jgi:hypothetical protein
MSRILVVFLAVGLAAAPLAQAQTAAPAPKPQPGASEPRGEPSRSAQEPARAGPDPRVCLEFTTNLEVHVCAEKYRPRRRAA